MADDFRGLRLNLYHSFLKWYTTYHKKGMLFVSFFCENFQFQITFNL